MKTSGTLAVPMGSHTQLHSLTHTSVYPNLLRMLNYLFGTFAKISYFVGLHDLCIQENNAERKSLLPYQSSVYNCFECLLDFQRTEFFINLSLINVSSILLPGFCPEFSRKELEISQMVCAILHCPLLECTSVDRSSFHGDMFKGSKLITFSDIKQENKEEGI